jgi:plastocyanin
MHSHILDLVSLLALPSLTQAQYASAPAPADTTPTTSASAASASTPSNIHVVSVGANNALAYSPNSITAAAGDMIEFHFTSTSHSVAQSSFSSPCAPFSNGSGTGFWSGFITTSGANGDGNVFRITVNDTATPLWFYCAVANHCQSGMVGVVNPG